MIFFLFFKQNWVLGYSLSNKTWWKPRLPMDQRPLVEARIANFGIFLDVFECLRFGWFFSVFFQKLVFLVFLVHPRPSWSSSRDVRPLFIYLFVCPLPMRFFCVGGLVQSLPRPWTGAIWIWNWISSRALKTRMRSAVRSGSGSQSRSWSWVEP